MASPPVLLLTWRRPALTRQVINAIRVAQPAQLFVASDGPREAGGEVERERVEQTRQLIDEAVDWPCTVARRFSAEHQGCRRGVSRAISWFFEHVERGVILEDDCVPHPEFFPFCAELLERWATDRRVWCISGDNAAGIEVSAPHSYGFVRSPMVWGWATWRRAWAHYDDALEGWAAARRGPSVDRLLPNRLERERRVARYDRLLEHDEPDSWAYRWECSCLLGGASCVVPRVNLVSNVGVGDDATHTRSQIPRTGAATAPIFPLKHPPTSTIDAAADAQIFDKVFDGAEIRARQRLGARLRGFVRWAATDPVAASRRIVCRLRRPG